VQFSTELRGGVLAGEITVSYRLWTRPKVKVGGRYRVGTGQIEVDEIELIPFATVTNADVRCAGEVDRESLRRRAAHAGPIGEDTLVYRIEFHVVVDDPSGA
jgi:ASCH domain